MVKYKFDIANEQVLLGAMLQDPNNRRRVLGSVNFAHWQGPRHAAIFEAIALCALKGIEVNRNNIAIHAKEDFGGIEYLDQLYSLEVVNEVGYYVTRLRQEATRLDAIDRCKELEKALADRNVEYTDCIRDVSQIHQAMLDEGFFRAYNQVGERWLDDFDKRCAGNVPFVGTGYKSLDSVLTDGFFRGGVTVIAGRPRSGKSTLVTDMIQRVVTDQSRSERIGVFPLEGGSHRFLDMLVSSITGILMERMVKHPDALSLSERRVIRMAIRDFVEDNPRLVVMDNPFLTLAEQGTWSNDAAMDKMEQLLAEGGYAKAVFDLWERSLTDLAPQRIASSLVRMQMLAQKYQTHCIIVHQLRRDSEDRRFNKSRRPSLGELKNSGAYEEIADLVLLIHREKIYKPFIKEDVIEVDVAKQKRGQDSVVMLADFQPQHCRLVNDRIDDVGEDENVSFCDDSAE